MVNIKFLQYFSLLRYKVLSKILNNKRYSLILDMEDSAQNLFSKTKTIELKKKCREGIKYLIENKVKVNECFLRINSIQSSFFKEDIKILTKAKKKFKVKAVFLPKTEKFEDINKVYKKLEIRIIPIIETKKGFKNLEEILLSDKKKIIYGVHYGHFDYCLDKKIWPLPEPYHYEYWDIVNPIIKLCNNYNKKFIQSPYPLINNYKIFWSMIKILKNISKKDCYVTLVNINENFYNKPKNIKNINLKKISKNKKYMYAFANKIIREYMDNVQQNKSFSLTKKRFIAPHQYLLAKEFIEEYEK